MEWFTISHLEHVDTPALVVYPSRVEQNIDRAIAAIKNPDHLRPHVKTHKMAEVSRMMMDKGITKFKCATIAEAEMLAMTGAADVLSALQPVGPRADRLLRLVTAYPETHFSCIVDDLFTAEHLSTLFSKEGRVIDVFIDLNTGMNRTGLDISPASDLITALSQLPSLNLKGLHTYDGHLRNSDPLLRQQDSDLSFEKVQVLLDRLKTTTGNKMTVVIGGSPSFPTHVNRDVECSPGTFVFWDWGYKTQFKEEPFEFAALVITRVISIVNSEQITTDLGHKSVAAENPLPRVHFLNAADAVPVAQSEEHLSLKVPHSALYHVGDVLYGVPVHICPTVALYDEALVVANNSIAGSWVVMARKRRINI